MSERIVYVIQEIPGTRYGRPRINILGAEEFGKLEFLLPEFSQIIFSPGPLIFELRKKLNFPLVISETIEQATPIMAGSPVNNK